MAKSPRLSISLRHFAAWWINVPEGAYEPGFTNSMEALRESSKRFPDLPLNDLVKYFHIPNYANEWRCYLCLLESEYQKDIENQKDIVWKNLNKLSFGGVGA